MNGMLAIIRKEFRSYFYSPVAHILLFIVLLIMGVLFNAFCTIYQQMNNMSHFGQGQNISLDRFINQYYQNLCFILAFITPMLTMRLFAEEKRQHTMELLLTAPLGSVQLILGKFLSAFFLLCLMLLLSSVHILFLVAWGNPDLATLMTTLLGIALSLACYLALGTLISAFCSSQLVAAVVNYVVILFLYLAQAIGQRMTTKLGPIDFGGVITYITPLDHFNTFAQGVLHVKDIVFFLSFVFLTLFVTHKVVESNRWR